MCRRFLPVVPIVLLCSLWLVGCTSDNSTKFPPGGMPYVSYSNDTDCFALRFPKTWTRTYDTSDGMTVQATSPLENASDLYQETAGVIVAYKDYDLTLADYNLRNVGELAKAFSGYNFHFIGDGWTTIDDKDAMELDFTYTNGSLTIYNQEFEIAKDDRVYVVLCTSTSDAFSRFKDIFTEIGHSLSVSYVGYPSTALTKGASRQIAPGDVSPIIRAARTAGMGFTAAQ